MISIYLNPSRVYVIYCHTLRNILPQQDILDARFSCLRSLFHVEKCRSILQNIFPAMSPELVILIDEKIYPDSNVNWKMTQIDISMMACFASVRRKEGMCGGACWRAWDWGRGGEGLRERVRRRGLGGGGSG